MAGGVHLENPQNDGPHPRAVRRRVASSVHHIFKTRAAIPIFTRQS